MLCPHHPLSQRSYIRDRFRRATLSGESEPCSSSRGLLPTPQEAAGQIGGSWITETSRIWVGDPSRPCYCQCQHIISEARRKVQDVHRCHFAPEAIPLLRITPDPKTETISHHRQHPWTYAPLVFSWINESVDNQSQKEVPIHEETALTPSHPRHGWRKDQNFSSARTASTN